MLDETILPGHRVKIRDHLSNLRGQVGTVLQRPRHMKTPARAPRKADLVRLDSGMRTIVAHDHLSLEPGQ